MSPCALCPAAQNVYVNINRIVSVGSRLLESGHYASQQIKQISGQLEQEWKAFAAALDERSTLLEMSASFHQKCDQVNLPEQSLVLTSFFSFSFSILLALCCVTEKGVLFVFYGSFYLRKTSSLIKASFLSFSFCFMHKHLTKYLSNISIPLRL